MLTFSLILGLISSIITILVVKDMKIFKTNCYGDRERKYLHLWEISLLCVSYFLPILGTVIFLFGFHVWFLIMYNGGDDKRTIVELNQKNLFHRIFLKAISILNKTIN